MNEKFDEYVSPQEIVLPPRARVISELSPIPMSTEVSSSNQVSLMSKNSRAAYQSRTNEYFFKRHSRSLFIDVESYFANIGQVIATPEYVPNTRPYYNEELKPVGVSSKVIDGFRSNYENPLQPGDLLINDSAIKAEFSKRSATLITQDLLQHYNRELSDYRRFQRLFAWAYGTDDWIDNLSGEYSTRASLLEFINNAERCSADLVLDVLGERKDSLSMILIHDNPELLREYRLLNQVIAELRVFNSIRTDAPAKELSIELLEQINRAIKADWIDLDACSHSIDVEVDGIGYEVNVQDLKNYRILRGLATCLSTRYIYEEGDNNNSNMSKKGEFFDFDWTKFGLLFDIQSHSFWDKKMRDPKNVSFKCTEQNMEHFPDLQDSNLFYWPTLQPDLPNIFLQCITKVLAEIEGKLLANHNAIPAQLIACLFEIYVNNRSPNLTFTELFKECAHSIFISFNAYWTSQSPRDLMIKDKIACLFTTIKEQLTQFINSFDFQADPLDTSKIGLCLDHLYGYIDKFSLLYPILLNQLKAPGILSAITANLGITSDAVKSFESVLVGNKEFFDGLCDSLSGLKANLQLKFERYQHNAYTTNDNINFKLLAGHPVFIFHKYKTFLKYILTDAEVFRALVALNIGNKAGSSVEGGIHDLLIDDELKRSQEIRQTLIAMPDFKLFLKQHGNFAFSLIQDEFATLREKYTKKEIHQVYYQRLVRALDPELVISKFLEICSECSDVKVELHSQDEDIPLTALWV